NIAGHFDLLDDRMAAALLAEARRDLIAGAAGRKSAALKGAFAHVLALVGEYGFETLLRDTIDARDRLRRFIDELSDGRDFTPLFEAFGFSDTDSAQSVAGEAWPIPGFSPEEFAEFCRIAEETGANHVVNAILPDAIAGFAQADPV